MRQDAETTDYLFRKLPKEVFDTHTHDDRQALMKLRKHGVSFKYDMDTVTKTLQILAISFFILLNETKGRSDVMEIMLNGVINEIVK